MLSRETFSSCLQQHLRSQGGNVCWGNWGYHLKIRLYLRKWIYWPFALPLTCKSLASWSVLARWRRTCKLCYDFWKSLGLLRSCWTWSSFAPKSGSVPPWAQPSITLRGSCACWGTGVRSSFGGRVVGGSARWDGRRNITSTLGRVKSWQVS